MGTSSNLAVSTIGDCSAAHITVQMTAHLFHELIGRAKIYSLLALVQKIEMFVTPVGQHECAACWNFEGAHDVAIPICSANEV
jgi:hypothetical protein